MYAPLAMTAVAAAQQLFSFFKPQGSTPALSSQAANNAIQGVQGHHPPKCMAAMIVNLQSTIDIAVKAGKLTDDQATQMKKKLDFIAQTLNKSQTGSGAQLPSDDLRKVKTELQAVRKQLFDALNPQGTASFTTGGAGYNLFKTMDGNRNGAIGRNEFATFISTLL